MNEENAPVLYEERGAIATIKLNRPSARNSLNTELTTLFSKALTRARDNEGIRCVVITGNGKAFCAGADLLQFGGVLEPKKVKSVLVDEYIPLVNLLVTYPKPVIASLNGVAAGAGMSIALACDFRIMSNQSALLPAFINLAMVPDAGAAFFLSRSIGYARAIEFLALGKLMPAPKALELGLAHRVVESDELEASTQAFAETLANLPTRAFGQTKNLLHIGLSESLSSTLNAETEAQIVAVTREDHFEGLKAFVERRPAKYQGR